ncbi:TVP38/TMEM64 family protein [Saccharibacillus alkalitolerans]|uniref:TVP38/TMEM64 family membrane protein n=1 Tax=Saccharibacillus alkalitolerans TaxID=2705290 RepID=A0ABX0F7Y8_9BACL|nr:TVP38/TMEM64 family protein [Saccharibacillus alkalitolerans]NGZ76423.1 TVP38/TMEM64 family protein [Saccharibacillus alkalitolerans]
MKLFSIRHMMNASTAAGLAACAACIVYGFYTGIFRSQEALEAFLAGFGVWAPLIFVLFQAVQVVIPILPGGIGCVAGVLVFGPIAGFIYNYVGICLGSLAAFLLARRYGKPIIESMFSPKLQAKYKHWTEGRRFNNLFAVGIFMPIAPDDFLCYLAGTTKMTFRRFTTIILLGKPLAIAAYSFGLSAAITYLARLFGIV